MLRISCAVITLVVVLTSSTPGSAQATDPSVTTPNATSTDCPNPPCGKKNFFLSILMKILTFIWNNFGPGETTLTPPFPNELNRTTQTPTGGYYLVTNHPIH